MSYSMKNDNIKTQDKDEIMIRLSIAQEQRKNFRILFRKRNQNNKTLRYMLVSRIMSLNLNDDYATVYDEGVQDIRRFKISSVICVELNIENPPMTVEDIVKFLSPSEVDYTHIDIKV